MVELTKSRGYENESSKVYLYIVVIYEIICFI